MRSLYLTVLVLAAALGSACRSETTPSGVDIPTLQVLDRTLGTGAVIRGWDQGVLGMRVGGTRTLLIPSNLAYGSAGRGSIPPNSALVFDIELLGVQ